MRRAGLERTSRPRPPHPANRTTRNGAFSPIRFQSQKANRESRSPRNRGAKRGAHRSRVSRERERRPEVTRGRSKWGEGVLPRTHPHAEQGGSGTAPVPGAPRAPCGCGWRRREGSGGGAVRPPRRRRHIHIHILLLLRLSPQHRAAPAPGGGGEEKRKRERNKAIKADGRRVKGRGGGGGKAGDAPRGPAPVADLPCRHSR